VSSRRASNGALLCDRWFGRQLLLRACVFAGRRHRGGCYKTEAVIHFAAYAYVGESVQESRKYVRNKVGNILNLLDAVVRRIIFSTGTTYGDPVVTPISEDQVRTR
jgi:nucleoside-diphosphate-sugar epimerase